MKRLQEQVREFMVKAGQLTPEKPVAPSAEVRRLRVKLIAEELVELCQAYDVQLDIINGNICVAGGEGECDLIEAYDATLDLMVVVIGNGVAMGVDLEPGWDEVHESNMSKFIDGHRRDDGKWVKGPSYKPAKLEPIIDSQRSHAK